MSWFHWWISECYIYSGISMLHVLHPALCCKYLGILTILNISVQWTGIKATVDIKENLNLKINVLT